MRRIVVGAQVSIDGVMQAPGGPSEDPTQGFRYGGWSIPHFDADSGEEIGRLFQGEFALLLGRKTYEIFAAYWPYHDESGPDGDIAHRFNQVIKYVVSGSGEVDTTWKGSVLLRDVQAVKQLREGAGPTLLTQGSTQLVHALLAHDLVDAISLFTMPVVLGRGKKLFSGDSTPHGYQLTGSRVAGSGVMVAHYERRGDVQTADLALPSPSPAERARQERMKREG